MTTTATITDLLRACDEPDVDRYLVLSQLADAYADAGDTLRSDAARWLAERGKWPDGWPAPWCTSIGPESGRLPFLWTSKIWPWVNADSESIRNAINAYAELGGRIE